MRLRKSNIAADQLRGDAVVCRAERTIVASAFANPKPSIQWRRVKRPPRRSHWPMDCLRSRAMFAMRSYRFAIASRSFLAHVVESCFAILRASSARSRQKPSFMSATFVTGSSPLSSR